MQICTTVIYGRQAMRGVPSGRAVTIMTDMNWTPVTDALPIKSGVYLVCNAHGTVFTALYLGSHW